MGFFSSVLRGASDLVRGAYSSVADRIYGSAGKRSGSLTNGYDPRSTTASFNGNGNRNPADNFSPPTAKSIEDVFGSGPEPVLTTTNDRPSKSVRVDASTTNIDLGTYAVRDGDQSKRITVRDREGYFEGRKFYRLNDKGQRKIEALILRKYNEKVREKTGNSEKCTQDQISDELAGKIFVQYKGKVLILDEEIIDKTIRRAVIASRTLKRKSASVKEPALV